MWVCIVCILWQNTLKKFFPPPLPVGLKILRKSPKLSLMVQFLPMTPFWTQSAHPIFLHSFSHFFQNGKNAVYAFCVHLLISDFFIFFMKVIQNFLQVCVKLPQNISNKFSFHQNLLRISMQLFQNSFGVTEKTCPHLLNFYRSLSIDLFDLINDRSRMT